MKEIHNELLNIQAKKKKFLQNLFINQDSIASILQTMWSNYEYSNSASSCESSLNSQLLSFIAAAPVL